MNPIVLGLGGAFLITLGFAAGEAIYVAGAVVCLSDTAQSVTLSNAAQDCELADAAQTAGLAHTVTRCA